MRIRQAIRALLAAVGLLGLLVGLPILLVLVGGNPLPSQLPSWTDITSALGSPDDGTLVLSLAVVLGWVAWLVLLVATAAEVVEQLATAGRGRRSDRVATPTVGLSLPRSMVRPLVAAMLAGFVSLPGLTTAAVADTGQTASTAAPTAQQQIAAEDVPTPTYTVQTGDTLSGIAARELGEGGRFGEIYAANADQIVDPDLIYPGEVLVLPGAPQTMGELDAIDIQVQAGNTLSGLAAEHLGDGNQWPAIYWASAQIEQPDGSRLSDPDLIEVGWQLKIPEGAGASNPADASTTTEAVPDLTPAAAAAGESGVALGTHLRVVEPAVSPGGVPQPQPATAPKVSPQAQADPGTGAMLQRSPQQPMAQPTQATETQAPRSGFNLEAPWLLAGLASTGGVMAGGLWLRLRDRRRTQDRHRAPGKIIGQPVPTALVPVEQTVQVLGPVAAVTVETLDRALRRLVSELTEDGQAVPPLVAGRLSATQGIDLFFAAAVTLPAPWLPIDEEETRWRLQQPASTPVPDVAAPYPLLSVVGTDDEEDTWLLNLEGLHVSIQGEQEMGQDLARYIAANTLLQGWSGEVHVDCLGIAEELQGLDPGRVTVTGDLEQAQLHVRDTRERALRQGVPDIATARVRGSGDDTWPARLVLVGANTPLAHELATQVLDDPDRVSASIVVCGSDLASEPSLVLQVDEHGRLDISGVGLHLVAAGLTADEARGCALLCEAAEDRSSGEVPGHLDTHPDDLQHYIDQAGAVRQDLVETRGAGGEPEAHEVESTTDAPATETETEVITDPSRTTLPAADEAYVSAAATTSSDLDQIAPLVPEAIAAKVRESDPGLDEDLEAWHDKDGRRPRLSLLGAVQAKTFGQPVPNGKAYLVEVLSFLALRPDGATPAQLAEAFGLTDKKARDHVSALRKWLGVDPRTGTLHLPHAADASRADGVKVYRVDGLLMDLDLFKRLHARGQARGAEGVEDLIAALRLVRGEPFDQLRAGGWGWFWDGGERVDQYVLVGIEAVAHTVILHSIQSGDLSTAQWAAQVSLRANPHSEVARLDMASVLMREGSPSAASAAAQMLRSDVIERTDGQDVPMDLPARTEEILQRHPHWWAGKDAAAS